MKNIFFVYALIIALTSFFSCNKCDEIVVEPCNDFQPNSEYCNWTVATNYAREGASVGIIYDTRFNSLAPNGDDWRPALTAINPTNWTADSIGQVFGIAIDHEENIYLASSDIYFQFGAFSSSNPARPNSSGRVFKCTPGAGWNAGQFVDLPNSGDPLNSLGNIAFDKWNKQLFVTNLEDGKIYRLSTNLGVIETYDPWNADVSSPGIVNQDERVWGVGVNNENGVVKVFFPRVTATERSIYSVTLVNGAFPGPGPGSEVLEISNVPGNQLAITDLAFSTDGTEMLVSERGHPHDAKVFSYSRTPATWNLNVNYYFVGRNLGTNSAGGVDFAYTEQNGDVSAECDEFFWASGNYMEARNSAVGYIYGLEGIAYTGNNVTSDPFPTANQDTDWFIDADNSTSQKGGIGDVEVFDCTACIDPCKLNDFDK